MIEQRRAVRVSGHESPGVQEEHQALVRLDLVLTNDEFSAPRRRAPIDGPVFVIGGVLPEPLEFALAALPAHRSEEAVLSVLLGQEIVGAEAREIRIDAYFSRRAEGYLTKKEPHGGGVTHEEAPERVRSAEVRHDAPLHGDRSTRGERCFCRQFRRFGSLEEVLIDQDLEAASGSRPNDGAYRVRLAE